MAFSFQITSLSAAAGGGAVEEGCQKPPYTRRCEMKAADGRNETAICKPVAPGDE